ncbi:potassium-transporting ATPase subunit KdpA [Nocardiopsis changdeensis]|uniref:Potassium-transporting ATPase potassium-binding subunit n=1 Tax=Nocardiopsis changdeensis TaxID=2831969 RepID=A0ABX8BGN0_9ACTN|nr:MULTISPECIES: potassium-transporting ATPase subunit KdpA [Nocardiopsis]QUX20504.1 potassium-transporting ATPase subunit A [Nocardiopsis changdeensis]QYX36435.1 potassium-transporting ATPase subunit KdpA [Nocardiopsis sp. MT53]
MTVTGWAQFLALIALLGLTAPVLGRYIAAVYGYADGAKAPGDRLFLPAERLVYRLCRVDPEREQHWTRYAFSLLAFSLMSFLFLYALLRAQGVLPLNPDGLPGLDPHIAFNAAVSFMTNTNWQAYAGETTMSHLSQMTGLTVQNFVSASAGMAVMAAFIRGIARRGATTLGNFWVDLTRGVVRVLLPLSFLVALVLVTQGVVQNLNGQTVVTTVEGAAQAVPGGPAASQVAIKQLGTNGGGFFDTNSAHPFENPTALSNLVQTWAILIIPFSMAFAFGHLCGDRRQGRAVFGIMFAVWAFMSVAVMLLEGAGNPLLGGMGVDQSAGYLEGKETRFGAAASGLWAAATTGTSNGSVNAMHDSFTPLGGGLSMLHMMFGELSPGGAGVGLNGLLVMVILTVFIAGLMIGRTPEYLGKKVTAPEIKLVMLYLLAMPVVLLGFAAASAVNDAALASLNNTGPHGLSEILYGYASTANNNGSAFAGLNAATWWYTTTMGVAMLVGRFLLILPVLAIAGSLARKRPVPATVSTLPTHTPMFGGLVVAVVVIVAGLTFLPALTLGPVAEYFSL